jgi:hypothetical protein
MSNATLQSAESIFRVKVKETQHGQTLTSVCYVKSASSDKADLQAAIDRHPLNTVKSWKFVKITA